MSINALYGLLVDQAAKNRISGDIDPNLEEYLLTLVTEGLKLDNTEDTQ